MTEEKDKNIEKVEIEDSCDDSAGNIVSERKMTETVKHLKNSSLNSIPNLIKR
jgi:hypothetical protein